MPELYGDDERVIGERAYFIWKREGCPNGRALDHWESACSEEREHQNDLIYDEGKTRAGQLDANVPVLLTNDRLEPCQNDLTMPIV